MAGQVKDEQGSIANLTISLNSLASSAVGVGRQSTLVDNTTDKNQVIEVSVSITLGTSPVANRSVYLYAIRSDNNGTPIADDGAGTSDAAWTRKSAEQLISAGTRRPAALLTGSAPATGNVLSGVFLLVNPGPKWGVGVVNDTGVALGTGHTVSWRPLNTLLP